MCVTGMIMMWAGTEATVPAGWLPCDGSAVSQSQYPELYAVIQTYFGASPPPGQFYLPDLRGRFVRGQDTSMTNDPDAASRTDMKNPSMVVGPLVGSLQSDALQGHIHPYEAFPVAGGGIGGGTYWGAGTMNTGTVDPASARVSTETRPVNVYVVFVMKT